MEKVAKFGIREHVTQFIQKFRILLLIILAIIVLGIIGAVVYEELHKSAIDAVTMMVEQLDSSYDSLQNTKTDDEKKAVSADFDILLKKASEQFKGSYAEQRAKFFKASFLFSEKQYADAELLFFEAASILPQSYLSSIALINAAFASEYAGNIEKSIEYLSKVAKDYEKSSAQAARALFNLGRIYESSEKWKEASEAYKKIIDSFAGSNWTKLARDRIIYLKSQAKL